MSDRGLAQVLLVGAGGFVGATARYGIAGLVQRLSGPSFPVGTLAVNVIGCLVIGAMIPFVEDRPVLMQELRLFGMVGLLGALTTFSTFSYETLELLRGRGYLPAAVNVAANVVLCLAAVGLGRALVRALVA